MDNLLEILENRFNKNMHRHENLNWSDVKKYLDNNNILKSIIYMEETGGEPDIIVYNDEILFVDISKESPKDRRNICYDKEARVNRKKFAPEMSAKELADANNIKLINEEMYFYMQSLETLDQKTSSWIFTDPSVREKGGALFGNHHYGRTFIYHNGADSYYAARGFRGYIKIK